MVQNLTAKKDNGLFITDGEFNQLIAEAFAEVFEDVRPTNAPISLKKLISDAHSYMNEIAVDALISAEDRIDLGKEILSHFYFFSNIIEHHSEAQLTKDVLEVMLEELIRDYNSDIKYCKLD